MRAARRARILSRSILFGVAVTFAVLLANILVSRESLQDQRQSTAWVTHTYDVLRELEAITSALYEAEAAQRAFVLMSDDDFLAPYGEATQRFSRKIDQVRTLVRDNPSQVVALERLAQRAQERLLQMDAVMEMSKESGLMAARHLLARNGNKTTTRAIRVIVEAMERDESALLESRLGYARASYRRAQALNLLAGALGLLAFGAFFYLVERYLRSLHSASLEIARQRELLAVTLHSIGDAVVTTDVGARVVVLNREAERLTGWTTDEAAGKPLDRIFRIVNEATREPVENPAMRALREGKVVGLANHTILISKQGTDVPIDDSAAPICDAAGLVSGVVLVFRDVTEERAASTQLANLATALAEADRRKNEFLAVLAHEIRNPLAAIRSSVTVLRLAGADPQASTVAMGAIDRQMRHLVRLVEDLLDVARISRGKLALQRTHMDLRHALEQAIEASRPLCDEAEQALEVEMPTAPLYVDGDGVRITQVIANLLSNACKFSLRGGKIRLAVGIEASHAIVTIRDTGIGIAPEHLPQLFDMFTQLDSTLERTQGGLGIGLNLVKQLIEMHGGRVEARSEGLGKGSEFVVHIPLVIASPLTSAESVAGEAAASQPAPEPAQVSLPVPAARASLRILVVDDNTDSAESLALLLRLEGHRTYLAHDGLQAVELALGELPDVVLLDIGLPNLNGYEAAKRIRDGAGEHRVRLIALTGWGQEADRARSREAGFDRHLVKPVDADELLALLTSAPEPPADS